MLLRKEGQRKGSNAAAKRSVRNERMGNMMMMNLIYYTTFHHFEESIDGWFGSIYVINCATRNGGMERASAVTALKSVNERRSQKSDDNEPRQLNTRTCFIASMGE